MAVLMLVLDVWAGPVRSQLDQPEATFCSKQLSLFSDNQSVIAAINFGRSKDDFLSLGTRYVHHQMAIRDSTLTLTYINTKSNVFADNLSRVCPKTFDFLLSQKYQRVFVSQDRLNQIMLLDI